MLIKNLLLINRLKTQVVSLTNHGQGSLVTTNYYKKLIRLIIRQTSESLSLLYAGLPDVLGLKLKLKVWVSVAVFNSGCP